MSPALQPAGPEQATPMPPTRPDAAALAEWRRLASKATPGERFVDTEQWYDGPLVSVGIRGSDMLATVLEGDHPCAPEGGGATFVSVGSPERNYEQEKADAAFIAHNSPDRILALLAAYEAERARAQALANEVEWLRADLMEEQGQRSRAINAEAEVLRLREALAFYADERSYRLWADGVYAVMEDGGENARAALAPEGVAE